MIPGREYSLSRILQLLWRGKALLVTGLVLGAAAGTASIWGVPNAYRAGATIMVQPQLVPQNFVKTTVSQTLEDRLRSMSERVLSDERLAPIVSDLKVYGDVSSYEGVERMRALIAVNVLRADAFRVAFVHRNAVMAARVTQRVAEGFVHENARTRTGLAEGTDQFMESQLAITRKRLAEHEEKLEEYRRTYSGELPSQMSSNLQAIQNAQLQLRAVDEAIQQDRDRKLRIEQTIANLTTASERAAMDAQLQADTPAPVDDTPPVDPFTDQVLQLRGQDALRQLPRVRTLLAGLQLQLKPDHPDIVRVQRVVAELERRVLSDLGPGALSPTPVPPSGARAQLLDQQRTRSLEQLHKDAANVEDRLAKREAEEERLIDLVRSYQRRVELIPTRETELTMLMRDYDTLRESYLGLLAKKQEAQMAAELERRNVGESFKIIEPARIPDRPFSPQRRMVVLQAAAIGLALALVVVGWREFQDEILRTEKEVATGLGIPVLAFLPVMTTDREVRRVRMLRLAWAGTTAALVVTVVALFYLRAVGRL